MANDFNDKMNEELANLSNTKDTTSEYNPQDIEANRTMAYLCYIFFLIPLFASKESPYVRFHLNQGILLWIVGIVLNIPAGILGGIPVIGLIIRIAVYLITLGLFIFGIMAVNKGQAKELPLIGGIKILK